MALKAGFISSSPEWHWERQFPDGIPVWNDVEFVFSGDLNDCDVVFVFDAIPLELAGKIRTKRRVFVASEPQSIKTYDRDFLSQFDTVLTTDPSTKHRNAIFTQVGLPWHIGVWDESGTMLSNPLNYRNFETFMPAKTKNISLVASNKAYTPGHRARLAFAERLKNYFGDEIDIFGRKINSFGDKTQVLNAYRYHIAIENSCYDHYWTEKLSDPYLALTYPIYHGCPNISEYFSPDAITCINIEDIEKSIRTIRHLIDSDVAEQALPELQYARQKVLQKNNLFHILSEFVAINESNTLRRAPLECERYFTKPKYRFKRKLQKPIEALAVKIKDR